MQKPKHHIFVCTSSRANGQQRGFCHAKEGISIMSKFMEEIEERALGGDVFLSNTGCFGICEKGPVVVVYPDNVWYGSVTPTDVPVILDEHIEGGKSCGPPASMSSLSCLEEMMAEEIAVVLGESGSSSSLNEPGTIAVFSRINGTWNKDREIPFSLDPAQGMKGMREKMADIIGFLGHCRILVTSSASGASYFELEKTRCAIWEISGKPQDFLNQVWTDEEKEAANERRTAQTPAGSKIPAPLEKTPGTFYISIKEVQGKRPDISSKQVLQQFIQRGGFLTLDITCTHVPPWIEIEAERRGYALETEIVDNETTKIRLTTSASK